jgi:hypothetical protein
MCLTRWSRRPGVTAKQSWSKEQREEHWSSPGGREDGGRREEHSWSVERTQDNDGRQLTTAAGNPTARRSMPLLLPSHDAAPALVLPGPDAELLAAFAGPNHGSGDLQTWGKKKSLNLRVGHGPPYSSAGATSSQYQNYGYKVTLVQLRDTKGEFRWRLDRE